MTNFDKMSVDKLELLIRRRRNQEAPPGSRWYTTDIQTALSLFSQDRYIDLIKRGFSYWTVILYDDRGEERLRAVGRDLARTICIAWCREQEMLDEANIQGQ